MRDDFSIDWPHGHVTRAGRKARVVSTDAGGAYPIVALVRLVGGCEYPFLYTRDGNYGIPVQENIDLINAPEPVEFVTRWVNVYRDGLGEFRKSRSEADGGVINPAGGRHAVLELIYENNKLLAVKIHGVIP